MATAVPYGSSLARGRMGAAAEAYTRPPQRQGCLLMFWSKGVYTGITLRGFFFFSFSLFPHSHVWVSLSLGQERAHCIWLSRPVPRTLPFPASLYQWPYAEWFEIFVPLFANVLTRLWGKTFRWNAIIAVWKIPGFHEHRWLKKLLKKLLTRILPK